MGPEGENVRLDRLVRYKVFFMISALLLALVSLDYAVGYKQNKLLEEKRALKKRLERLAYYMERTDIREISYSGKGKEYRMKLSYENIHPEDEMWIMVPSIKVFVQVGTLWRELSVNDMRMKMGDYSAEKLDRPRTMTVKFTMPYKNYEELMRGYMHMKVNSFSYISAEAIAKEDIMEKSEDIFIYVSTAKKEGRVRTLLH